jgi:hypothetical protein
MRRCISLRYYGVFLQALRVLRALCGEGYWGLCNGCYSLSVHASGALCSKRVKAP